jgi:hypothetical protein
MAVKATQEKKALTLGALIESGYRACGEPQARAIVRLAAEARLIIFKDPIMDQDRVPAAIEEAGCNPSEIAFRNACATSPNRFSGNEPSIRHTL